MKLEFQVQNVKCNGCVSNIRTGLARDGRVKDVAVDIPSGRVTVTTDADIRAELSTALKNLGYPENA